MSWRLGIFIIKFFYTSTNFLIAASKFQSLSLWAHIHFINFSITISASANLFNGFSLPFENLLPTYMKKKISRVSA
jgi:hypothetical protein